MANKRERRRHKEKQWCLRYATYLKDIGTCRQMNWEVHEDSYNPQRLGLGPSLINIMEGCLIHGFRRTLNDLYIDHSRLMCRSIKIGLNEEIKSINQNLPYVGNPTRVLNFVISARIIHAISKTPAYNSMPAKRLIAEHFIGTQS